MSSTLNGRPRKQLSDQLDRMDTLIDGLADALPEAVADACREGARLAVKEAITELLLNPEVRAQLTQLLVPAASSPEPVVEPATVAPQPSVWQRLKAKLRDLKNRVQQKLSHQFAAWKSRASSLKQTLTQATRLFRGIVPLKQIVIGSVGLGLAIGLVVYCCPHAVGSVLVGLVAGGTSLVVQVRNWFRRCVNGLGLLN